MPEDRRQEWAAAPTILWFTVFAVAAIVARDRGVTAFADRIAKRSEPQAPRPGGLFGTSGGPDVADVETDTDTDTDADRDPDPVRGGGTAPGTGSGSAARPAAAARQRIEDTCVDGTADACKRWAMEGFYRAVAAARAGTARSPVRVSYYGDSVTSTDAIPARVRSRLQTELGDGGPGWIWAARPHRFVHHEGVSIANTGTWTTWIVSLSPAADGLHGVGGSTTQTVSGTAKLSSKTPFTRIEVYYLGQPNGGSADVVVGGEVKATVDTARDPKQPGFVEVQAAAPTKVVELATRGKVRFFGLALENATGAVVDNMGLISATVKNMAHNQADHWASQLAHRDADLVIVMLGANEAEWLPAGKAAMAEYRARYEKILAPIRTGVPESACLVVSPLDQAQSAEGNLASRPVMPMLVAAQRAAAQATGCAFFSAYDWAGGKGSAARWYKRRLVGDDFQHLSRKGANKLADAIVDSLLAGAQGFQAN
jgi:lysophospholipase L1-like esterase